eukprot:scaffold280035_cov14-Tisochrysis_lutea.AAC.1
MAHEWLAYEWHMNVFVVQNWDTLLFMVSIPAGGPCLLRLRQHRRFHGSEVTSEHTAHVFRRLGTS